MTPRHGSNCSLQLDLSEYYEMNLADEMHLKEAIRHGKIEWLQEHLEIVKKSGTKVCNFAVLYNRLHILQWARNLRPPLKWSKETCNNAAKTGNLPMLQWLRSQDPPDGKDPYGRPCPCDGQVCVHAASKGHIHVLQWIWPQMQLDNYHINDIIDESTSKGHLNVMKWLKTQPLLHSYDESACNNAAAFGHLGILQWLRSQDPPFPWDSTVCICACENGHLDVLKWAVANGCEWDPCAFDKAGLNNHMHIVNWILASGLKWVVSHNTYLPTLKHYNVHRWYSKFSPDGLWLSHTDSALSSCLQCSDLEQLIKDYI